MKAIKFPSAEMAGLSEPALPWVPSLATDTRSVISNPGNAWTTEINKKNNKKDKIPIKNTDWKKFDDGDFPNVFPALFSILFLPLS